MKIFQIRRSLWVPQPIDKVFYFFADVRNLDRLTPKWLKFYSETADKTEIKEGAHRTHRLKVRGIPIRWVSEIIEWDPPYGFVDEQRKGPYRFWRHEHTFEEERGGTLCADAVKYSVTGGELVNRFLVAPDLKRVFDYRQDSLRRIFSQPLND